MTIGGTVKVSLGSDGMTAGLHVSWLPLLMGGNVNLSFGFASGLTDSCGLRMTTGGLSPIEGNVGMPSLPASGKLGDPSLLLSGGIGFSVFFSSTGMPPTL